MASFTDVRAKRDSITAAAGVHDDMRSTYHAAKRFAARLALYSAGTDPVYNAVIDRMFTAAQRTEMAQMAQAAQALVADWETNHAGAIAE